MKKIAVLQRGWVVVGDYLEDGEKAYIKNGSVVRRWGTSQGLGELAEKGPLKNTILDPCPDIDLHVLTTIFRIKCNETNWK